jgi:peptide deformylase
MAIRTILHYPDPRLRQKAQPVEKITPELLKLIDDMAETMYAAPGVGLAANQIGEPVSVFLVDIASEDEPSDLRVFINPEITSRIGTMTFSEGCLSFPEVTEDIKRSETVTVRALDRNGNSFELTAAGLLAVAIQHESDHLDGVLMIDHVGPLKKRLMARKVQRSGPARASR